jgi:hypothetical protein
MYQHEQPRNREAAINSQNIQNSSEYKTLRQVQRELKDDGFQLSGECSMPLIISVMQSRTTTAIPLYYYYSLYCLVASCRLLAQSKQQEPMSCAGLRNLRTVRGKKLLVLRTDHFCMSWQIISQHTEQLLGAEVARSV